MILAKFPEISEYWGYDVPPGTAMPICHQDREVPAKAGSLVRDRRLRVCVRPRGTLDIIAIPAAHFVYIDGDHSRRAVEWDTQLARAATMGYRRSVIVWHDYGNPGTPDVAAVLDADQSQRLVHIARTWLVFEFSGGYP